MSTEFSLAEYTEEEAARMKEVMRSYTCMRQYLKDESPNVDTIHKLLSFEIRTSGRSRLCDDLCGALYVQRRRDAWAEIEELLRRGEAC